MNRSIGHRSAFGIPWWVFLIGFLGIAITMNWEEHRAHILGTLPYLFLLSCPLMHFLMHGGHGDHEGHGGGGRGKPDSDRGRSPENPDALELQHSHSHENPGANP